MPLAVILAVVAASCGFPDHTFEDDSLFYGKGSGAGGSSAGGSGGPDSGVSGGAAGGQSSGGTGARAGAGGASTGGNIGQGGIMTVIEGGRPPPPDARPDAPVGSGGGGGGGAGGDAAIDTGPVCGTGLDYCPGGCVDLLTDKDHCGVCTTKCTAPNVCTGGQCLPPCDPGLTVCNGLCVDVTTDEANCGACNRACPSGTVCESKQCVIDCGTLTRCPGNLCVDTTSDPLHCGNCTTVCNSGQTCSGSPASCKTTCQSPSIPCGVDCVNPQTDDAHCGGCTPCASGKHCVAGTCQTLVENCQNGIDDDRDGAVDCADSDCTAFVCATTPLGWTGPVALWSGAAGSAPACSGAYPSDLLDAHDNLNVPTSTCPNCTCTPQNAACPQLQFYYDTTTDCSASSAWIISVDSSGTCTPLFLLHNGSGGTARSSQLVPPSFHQPSPITAYATGTCVASQPTPTFSTPSWNTDVLACGAASTTAGGCGAGQCLPKPTAPYKGQLCIFRPGINACPSSYPNAMPSASSPQYYTDFTDNRQCSSCTCGGPTCGGTVTAYTDTSCSQDATPVDITGLCTTIPVDPSLGSSGGKPEDTRSIQWKNGGAACGQAASSLTGSVTPNTPVTVCCQN